MESKTLFCKLIRKHDWVWNQKERWPLGIRKVVCQHLWEAAIRERVSRWNPQKGKVCMSDVGTCSILNVVGGDTKISFDKSNPQEAIRAARIVRDMLRRGYALLVEVERNGEKAYERALDFREDTGEYVIAGYDPQAGIPISDEARPVILNDQRTSSRIMENPDGEDEAPQAADMEKEVEKPRRGRPRGARRAIPADSTRAVAVARSAGG